LALDVTRQVSVDLKPPVLLNEDFMDSLKWLAATMTKRYGLTVALKGALRPGWPGHEVSILLFQTVRELLFNVVKHAGVKQAQVEVTEEASYLRLLVEVSDEGQGFDVAAVMAQRPERGGIGLVSIRNRLELLGGQFHIESQPGRGTRATVVVLV
jgi:signal transduction histidine kinase